MQYHIYAKVDREPFPMGRTFKNKCIQILENNRALVILLFCLPASFIFNLLLHLKKIAYRFFYSSPTKHDERVREIQLEVQKWHKLIPEPKKLLCTARPNWMSLSTCFFEKNKCHQVKVDLFNILEFNEEALTIRVEPMVTVRDITKFLIPKGYILSVTLEIGDATVGGLALAAGMTTHSHKVGLYHESIVSYELVLGDGSLVTASRDDNIDLFNCLPWSHGSLGFLVALTLRIVKVKPYIKMEYTPIEGQKDYCDFIRMMSGDLGDSYPIPDYVEATIYSKNKAVVMTGHFSDCIPSFPINYCSRWYKPWFYKHAEQFLEKGKHVELIPLEDYLFRHDRAIFWVVESMIPFGNNLLFRILLGWLLPPKPAFLKFTTTPGIRSYTFTKQVFQDIVLPIRKLEEQINFSEELFDLFPLLVYPCKVFNHGLHSGQIKPPKKEYMVEGSDYAIYNDLGIYGVPGYVKRMEKYNPIEAMRKMEKFTRDVGGFSFLYADILMDRKEFEGMFDLTLYEKVRQKYHATEAFPHLYDKVKPEIDFLSMGDLM